MKHEFWAEFDLYEPLANSGDRIREIQVQLETSNQKSNRRRKEIMRKLKAELRDLQRSAQAQVAKVIFQGRVGQKIIPDFAARLSHLAQLAAVDCVCEGRTTQCQDYAKGENGLQHWYYAGDLTVPRGDYQTFLCCRLRWMGTILDLANHEDTVGPALPDLSFFPPGSWAMQVHFTLRKPYISKDDVDFYILDNPVKKEWVFKVPYVAPSQWKGALRAAMIRQLAEERDNPDQNTWIDCRLQLARLFGNEKGVSLDDERFEAYLDRQKPDAAQAYRQRLKEYTPTGFLAGRLHFYPTFFDRIGLEVINPHERKTGAGKNPIYFECVPAGTPGVFTLLYVPLDAGPKDEATIQADLQAVARGVRAMLTEYGFGAKTSSGYGVANVNGVEIRTNGIEKAEEIFWNGWEGHALSSDD